MRSYVIQSDLSQKEKKKYRLLMHICGIQKNGTDEPICKAETEAQIQKTDVWTPKWGGRASDVLGDWD